MLFALWVAENVIPSILLFALMGVAVRPMVGARLTTWWALLGMGITMVAAAFVRLVLSAFRFGESWLNPGLDGGIYNVALVAITAFVVHHMMAASVGVPVEVGPQEVKGEDGPWR